MGSRTYAHKFVMLRGELEARWLSLRAQCRFPNEREERQVIGRYQTLEAVVDDLATVNESMKPAQLRPLIEGVLDRLGERKAGWMVYYVRERQRHGINQLGEWTAEGAIAQIDEIVVQLLARLSPKWHTASTKLHGRYFQVYHCLNLAAMLDSEIGKRHWLSPERDQWFQEVAIIQVEQPQHQLEEVFRLTNHSGDRGWDENHEVIWRGKTRPVPATTTGAVEQGGDRQTSAMNQWQIPRSTSVGDVIVALLSGATWITANVGFEPLISPDQRPATFCGGGTGHE